MKTKLILSSSLFLGMFLAHYVETLHVVAEQKYISTSPPVNPSYEEGYQLGRDTYLMFSGNFDINYFAKTNLKNPSKKALDEGFLDGYYQTKNKIFTGD